MMSCVISSLTLTIVLSAALVALEEDTLHFGRFGKVTLYRETQPPS
jgi:hypothetical protein